MTYNNNHFDPALPSLSEHNRKLAAQAKARWQGQNILPASPASDIVHSPLPALSSSVPSTSELPPPPITVVRDTSFRTVPKNIKVAAYCRVSTSAVSQESSIENQKIHFESMISDNPNWELAGIYWETGVSGTHRESRPALQKLLSDCEAGKIDLIITKSISRFARDTIDCLKMIRRLKSLGINIHFEKENIDTGSMESELLLALFSSFAQEESLSISRNTAWTKRKQFQNGTFKYSIAPYGYQLSDGNFVLEPAQATVVKEIFDAVLSGQGTTLIARTLNARGIPTGTKKRDGSPGEWTAGMIGKMIPNVVYIGDVLNQKTYRDDHYRVRYNYGERTQYYMKNHHEAIIDRESFALANLAFRQRGLEKGNILQEDRQLRDNPHRRRYPFSGRLRCGCCGSSMRRLIQKNADGSNQYHWGCTLHISDISRCSMRREYEARIQNAFQTMLNKLVFAEHFFLNPAILGSETSSRQLASLLRVWKNHSEGFSPEELFTNTVTYAVIRTASEIEFHLTCGLVLTEPLV